jgi:hypothetical protein
MKFRIGKCALIGQMPLILVPAESRSVRSNLFALKVNSVHCTFAPITSEEWAYLELPRRQGHFRGAIISDGQFD